MLNTGRTKRTRRHGRHATRDRSPARTSLFSEGTSTGLSDTQLLGRFAIRGDEMAFAAILSRHGPMVMTVRLGISAMPPTPMTPSRPRSSCWPGRPGRHGPRDSSVGGCTRLPTESRSAPVPMETTPEVRTKCVRTGGPARRYPGCTICGRLCIGNCSSADEVPIADCVLLSRRADPGGGSRSFAVRRGDRAAAFGGRSPAAPRTSGSPRVPWKQRPRSRARAAP